MQTRSTRGAICTVLLSCRRVGAAAQVAQAGRIVLLSFHQPSPAMFELLDRAFLMARGHVLFCGQPGAAPGFLAKAGAPCPPHTAVAEHMLSAVSDPAMLAALMAHAAEHGPFAGIAAVRAAAGPLSSVGFWGFLGFLRGGIAQMRNAPGGKMLRSASAGGQRWGSSNGVAAGPGLPAVLCCFATALSRTRIALPQRGTEVGLRMMGCAVLCCIAGSVV